MRLYMTFRQTDGSAVAAAKASISLATAYRFEQDRRPPSSINEVRTAADRIPSRTSSTRR